MRTKQSPPDLPAHARPPTARHRFTFRRAAPSLALATSLVAAALGAGCAHAPNAAQVVNDTPAPAQWQEPLPHHGTLTDLRDWWQGANDPLLVQLIDAAQRVSPTVATAASRIAQARATVTSAGGALMPMLNANASVVRGRQDFSLPLGTQSSAGLQAGWEIDVFGGARAARDAAQARYQGAHAGWHDARVSVAAEVADTYVGLRACESQLAQASNDSRSRDETSRLTDLSTRAGFTAPANAALARASAAQGRMQRDSLRAQCDLSVKALVSLTGLDEPALRQQLAAGTGQLPQPAQIAVQSLPADLLGQRPDLYVAGRELVAASADVSTADAARLPRITLAGTVGRTRLDSGDTNYSFNTWTLGPLAVTLPLFDGGTRRANADAAHARYDEAVNAYRARLRGAVREGEEALVQLNSATRRSDDARTASEGFDASFRASESRYGGGLGNLFELEDARRSALLAQNALVDVRREQVAAWIALYRALGGGWSARDVEVASAEPPAIGSGLPERAEPAGPAEARPAPQAPDAPAMAQPPAAATAR